MATTVTSQIQGITISESVKAPVHAVSTANLTLSGLQTVDGVALNGSTLKRVLAKDQTDPTENGIYDASSSGWTRAKDFDGNRDVVQGTMVIVEDSSILYRVTSSNPITIGTSSISFEALGPTQTQSDIGLLLNPRTAAEIAAGVTPVDYSIPNHETTGTIIVDRYGINAVPGTTNMTAALTAANSVLASGGSQQVGDGGVIEFYEGVYSIDNFNPTKANTQLKGRGPQKTVLRGRVAGSAATRGVITLNDVGRGLIEDMSLDGNGLKEWCLGFCPTTAGANAGGWTTRRVYMYGGTVDQLVLGNGTNNPDVSNNSFYDCAAQGGAFGSSNPSQSQIHVAGSNTLLINWYGGVIGGGQIANNIVMENGEFTSHGANGINSTSYHCLTSGGQFRSYDEHVEGTGGFLHTLSSDPQSIASGQHLIQNGQITNTGANTAGLAVLHEAGRQLSINSTFFNEDVKLNSATGRIYAAGTTFGAGNGFINGTAGGKIYGPDVDGGMLVASNTGVRFSVVDQAITNGSLFYQTALDYSQIVALSASDVNGPNFIGMMFLVRNATVGGFALVVSENNVAPVIVSQVASASVGANIFVLGAAGAGEIQVKLRGAGLGVAFRAGATRNNDKLVITVLACN